MVDIINTENQSDEETPLEKTFLNIPSGLSDDCFEEALIYILTKKDHDMDRR